MCRQEVAAHRGAEGCIGALKQPCGTKPLKLQIGFPHTAVMFHLPVQLSEDAQGLLTFFDETLVGVQSHVEKWIVYVQDADAPFFQFHTEEGVFISIGMAIFVE